MSNDFLLCANKYMRRIVLTVEDSHHSNEGCFYAMYLYTVLVLVGVCRYCTCRTGIIFHTNCLESWPLYFVSA